MALPDPHEAMARLLDCIAPVESETIPLNAAAGRVLAETVRSDRPSPPADVSAMDGYAVRLRDMAAAPSRRIAVAAEVAIGHEPPELPVGQAVRIFTGGAVPAGADVVIPRERVTELADAVEIPESLEWVAEQHIRRRGENLAAGQEVIASGAPVTAAVTAALAAFGVAKPRVYRRLRGSIIVTGNELRDVEASVEPWQLRDSNGPMLAALFANVPWIERPRVLGVKDDPAAIQTALREALNASDAVLLTGGVSMGDYDHVPAAVEAVGGRIVFHRVALRPGKPLLGAIGTGGQAIFGLPGNPVSALTTARRFAAQALRKKAGFSRCDPQPPMVQLTNPDHQRLDLWWYRPVRLIDAGRAELIPTRGSGDLVSIARSDGFIEIPIRRAPRQSFRAASVSERADAGGDIHRKTPLADALGSESRRILTEPDTTHFSFYPWSLS